MGNNNESRKRSLIKVTIEDAVRGGSGFYSSYGKQHRNKKALHRGKRPQCSKSRYMIIIGITGIIGSGKTTVSDILRKKGITVIDLDALAKKAIMLKEVQEEIASSLGKEYVEDGKPAIEKIKELVFSDKEQLRLLESIIHPRVRENLWREVDKNRANGKKLVVLMDHILFETDLYKSVDRIVVVSTEKEKIKKRLRKRGLTDNDMERRMLNQIPLEEKEKKLTQSFLITEQKKTSKRKTGGY
jgi:dephospho-CoA kinase